MFSNSAKSANHSGAVVVKSARVLLDATKSHQIGVRKYSVATIMTAIATAREIALSRMPPSREGFTRAPCVRRARVSVVTVMTWPSAG